MIDVEEVAMHLSVLIDRVEAGEEFIITRFGEPIARLSPYDMRAKSIGATKESLEIVRIERASCWRAHAQANREAAERLAVDLWPVACFHAQQASERALKALLTRVQGDAVPTHHAHVLLRALDESGEPVPGDVVSAANALDCYYISTRYPDALDFPDAALVYSTEDARQAIGWADSVLRWCDERIAAQPAID